MLHMDNQENIENLRVASFSAYLNSSEENFVLKITGANKDHSLDLDPPEMTLSGISSGKRKTNLEGEIDIFGADKYFNTRMELEAPKLIDHNKMNIAPSVVDRKQSSTEAPSVFSEASSNSQRPLLPKLLKNPSLVKRNCGNYRRFFIGFGCIGPCSNKKSVHIEEGVENGCLIHTNDQLRKESFRFANTIVLDGEKSCQQGLKGDNFEILVPKAAEEIMARVQEPRHSIEVFGSSRNKRDDKMERILERKLSMLTWDAIPKAQNQVPTMGSGPFDDNQSDASSDLFEIETLSGNGSTFLTNQGSEKIPYCMSPTHYAPSEASIEWSIVTASAVDFSFASEYDEKSIAGDFVSNVGKMKEEQQKEGQIKRYGGLLGCKSHKAVSVAETAHMSADKAKFVGESKLQGRVFNN